MKATERSEVTLGYGWQAMNGIKTNSGAAAIWRQD
jgi:hypothetical protein